ncbi:MAG: prepilin-type N-terminal cleavage/methylation domain-containing protein [Deltaproteobacteria bacterium]|nr:prepilin-type N-terminal cleavage/methylation domain-containing protein [Deltaproteobacteria bacterium]
MSNKGFTLIEIIIAIALLAIVITPLINAFAPAAFTTDREEKLTVCTNYARGTLARLLTLDFADLDANKGDPVDLAILLGSSEEADKETFSVKGVIYTPVVAIAEHLFYVDDGLLEITVTVENVTLKTLKAEY